MKPYCGSHPFMKGVRILGLVIIGLITLSIIGLIFGFFVQWLWNRLMPAIFKLPTITYWQAFGVIILAKLIFGSVGHHFGNQNYRGYHRHDFHRRFRNGYDQYKLYHSHCRNIRDDEEWKLKGGWRNWDYYDEWWRKEGKTAFENYIDRVVTKDGDGNDRED